MKNFVKIGLFGLLAGVVFFGGYQKTYAACALISGTTVYNCDLDNISQCDQATCSCGGGTITFGTICSLSNIAPGDGPTQLTGYGIGCGDLDGCLCPDGTPLVGLSCVAPVVVAPVITSLGSPSVVGSVVNFSFSADKVGTMFYIGDCGAGSISNAIASSNTIVFNLDNITKTYNNCKIYIQDSSDTISNILDIPSFSITATTGSNPPSGGGGGGSSTPYCYASNLVCTGGKYVKKAGAYCDGGDLGKVCTSTGSNLTGNTTGELYNIISSITGLSVTGFENLLSGIKNSKYVDQKEYTIQSVKIKLYVPKYNLKPIDRAIGNLSRGLLSAINKKLQKLNDYSYIIEDFENIGVDNRIAVYKEVGAITKLYNDMMITLYMVLDMKKKELLPLAKYYLTTYISEVTEFKK